MRIGAIAGNLGLVDGPNVPEAALAA